MSDTEEQIAAAEAKIKDHRTQIKFPEGGGAVEIDGTIYKVEPPVFKLIVDAISSNQHLIQQIQQYRSQIIRQEIMRGIT